MLRQLNDLLIVVAVACLSAVVIVLAPGLPVLRAVCSILLVLVLPGYALAAALLPGRFLDLPQRILFSLGLSLVVAVLTGLILNQLNQPLQLNTWDVVLAVFTIIMALVAAWRKRSLGAQPAAGYPYRFRPSWREGLLLVLALLVAGAALQLARLPTSNPSVSGYTMLWIVPASDGTNQVRVGVDSQEFTPTRYNLQVLNNGRLLQQWTDVAVEPGNTWQTSIGITTTAPLTNTIEARLYRSDQPDQVYRHVSLVRGE